MEINKIINAWEELVDECINGYNNNVFELDYDLLIRKELDEILNSSDSKNFEKNKIRVDEIDKIFKKNIIFLDSKEQLPFFERKFILKFGSKIYCDSVYDVYNMHIKLK